MPGGGEEEGRGHERLTMTGGRPLTVGLPGGPVAVECVTTQHAREEKKVLLGRVKGTLSVERVVVGVGSTVMRDARMDEQFPGPGGPS